MGSSLPIIDVSELVAGNRGRRVLWPGAAQLREACEESGFFYVVGHGVDESLQARLRDLSRTAHPSTTPASTTSAFDLKSWRPLLFP